MTLTVHKEGYYIQGPVLITEAQRQTAQCDHTAQLVSTMMID